MADVHVVLRAPVDLGDGPSEEHTFFNASHLVDKQSGWLHICTLAGTIASFPPSVVLSACRVGTAVGAGPLA